MVYQASIALNRPMGGPSGEVSPQRPRVQAAELSLCRQLEREREREPPQLLQQVLVTQILAIVGGVWNCHPLRHQWPLCRPVIHPLHPRSPNDPPSHLRSMHDPRISTIARMRHNANQGSPDTHETPKHGQENNSLRRPTRKSIKSTTSNNLRTPSQL